MHMQLFEGICHLYQTIVLLYRGILLCLIPGNVNKFWPGHDKIADWWSVGILLYEMLTRKVRIFVFSVFFQSFSMKQWLHYYYFFQFDISLSQAFTIEDGARITLNLIDQLDYLKGNQSLSTFIKTIEIYSLLVTLRLQHFTQVFTKIVLFQ